MPSWAEHYTVSCSAPRQQRNSLAFDFRSRLSNNCSELRIILRCMNQEFRTGKKGHVILIKDAKAKLLSIVPDFCYAPQRPKGSLNDFFDFITSFHRHDPLMQG